MRLLLDTHVLLWIASAPERLGRHRGLLEDSDQELLVSAATAWEIAIKHGLGRLELPEPPRTWTAARVAAISAVAVPVDLAAASAVADLPPIHRDPFDRLLVAQAGLLDATLVTADRVLTRYPVEHLLLE